MSRIGKSPVAIPEGVNVDLKDGEIIVKGKQGELKTKIHGEVKVTVDSGQVVVEPANDTKFSRSMWGTTRNNIANLVQGVTEGFTKELDIRGVGYRAALKGNILVLALGFSHDVYFVVPEGITIAVEKQTGLKITGSDKQLVGEVAAQIRSLRKPEPYKGKGVRYVGEYVRQKEGKKK